MFVDKNSPIPAYHQLKNILLKKIQSGEYPAGGLIPSERDLSENYSISRMTVRQALNQLVLEGVLTRERGRGTFVSRTKIEQKNIMSFSETVRQKGLVPNTRVLHFAVEVAPEDVCRALDLKPGERIFRLSRLRLAGDMPVGIEEEAIPEKYCPMLEKFDLTHSLYHLFKQEYSYSIAKVDNVVEAARPSREERDLLQISQSIPVLKMTSVNYTDSGIKLFFERSSYRSDEYQCSMRIYVNQSME